MLIASLIRYVKLRGLKGAAERNGQVWACSRGTDCMLMAALIRWAGVGVLKGY
jgi:hypothetical protein